MSIPVQLSNLSPRDAAVDAVLRALTGLDTNDQDMFASAWIQDDNTVVDMDGAVIQGFSAIKANIYDALTAYETMHVLSNVRVDTKDGSDVILVSAYGVNHHYRSGEGAKSEAEGLISGNRYLLELKREGSDESGLWKIAKWNFKNVWLRGDMTVME